MQASSHRHRVIRKAFSIPEDLAASFENEAQTRDMHASTLLTQLMKKWITFDLPLQKIGLVSIPIPCFQSIIEKIDEKVLANVARQQSTKNFGAILSLLGGRANISSIIESYYDRWGKYSNWYSFSFHKGSHNNYPDQISLYHAMDSKWSKYLAEYNSVILENHGCKIECKIDSRVVTFELIHT
ncbi:MAG: hypothetical protein HRF40_07530 [Nitrososphaera sp.]|jgi:hypothetical protein